MSIQTIEKTITVKEAIQSRHSIRKFVQETLPIKDIEQIIGLVSLAPSAWNLQPWRFHLVTEVSLKEKLQEAAYGQQQVTSAPAVFLVASDMEDVISNLAETIHPGLPQDRKEQEIANLASFFGNMSVEDRGQWGLTQTNIALGYLMITLQSMGYASVPMLGFDHEKVKELLELPDYVKFAAMVPFGHADAEGYAHHRHDVKKVLYKH